MCLKCANKFSNCEQNANSYTIMPANLQDKLKTKRVMKGWIIQAFSRKKKHKNRKKVTHVHKHTQTDSLDLIFVI